MADDHPSPDPDSPDPDSRSLNSRSREQRVRSAAAPVADPNSDPNPDPNPTGFGVLLPAQPPTPSLTLREKHPLATRWMHWLNFPLLALMIWSGLMIYWADSAATGEHSHEVYRIGIGSWTLFRFFPDGFYDKLGITFS